MTYPRDILAAAENALDALLCNDKESCGGYAELRDASINDIAKALMAEREACAKIADDRAAAWPSDERWVDINASVASAIRNQNK